MNGLKNSNVISFVKSIFTPKHLFSFYLIVLTMKTFKMLHYKKKNKKI